MRAENSPPPAAARVERRVQAAVGLETGRRQPDGLTRWLVVGAGVVTALSAFAVISFAVSDDPEPVPATQPDRPPAVSGPATFAGTKTVTETVVPPDGGYYAPGK